MNQNSAENQNIIATVISDPNFIYITDIEIAAAEDQAYRVFITCKFKDHLSLSGYLVLLANEF